MSDLEEECSSCPDRRCPSEHGKNPDVSLDCERDWFWPARAIYNAIPIPGELNTKVRAAIESDRKRKDGFMHQIFPSAEILFRKVTWDGRSLPPSGRSKTMNKKPHGKIL